MGVGAWAWGDSTVWGYGKGYTEEDVFEAFSQSLDAGINFIDTAEIYGWGGSEALVGKFLRRKNCTAVIATKFLPFPWRLTKGSFRRALRRSLHRLQLESVDLYQIHWPLPPVPVRQWMDAMADAVGEGLIKAVGVSNYNASMMRRAHERLLQRGIPLASNQIEFSLLNQKILHNGLLDVCRELDITPIAYSPLAMGMLTGKYSPGNPPPGARRWKYGRAKLAHIAKVCGIMREIGESYGGKSPAQVALNWTICKGAVPIPGAKNGGQALQNAGALGWRLSDEEVQLLDDLVREVQVR